MDFPEMMISLQLMAEERIGAVQRAHNKAQEAQIEKGFGDLHKAFGS
jgi:hypothetical protein